MIPPALWTACDYVLQYNFVIAHVAGSMNTAADFLYRTEVDPTEKPEMTIRNDIHTEAIDVNCQSSDIVKKNRSMFFQMMNLLKSIMGRKTKRSKSSPKRYTQ